MVFEPFIFFSSHPSIAVIINHCYFTVGWRNTTWRYFTV